LGQGTLGRLAVYILNSFVRFSEEDLVVISYEFDDRREISHLRAPDSF
jgi:hypothetical protein